MSSTMSMGMSSTTLATSTATATTTAASATATSMPMNMGGMAMGGNAECQISMLWNWNTIDSCFLTSSWHIKTPGMFAGSCIGVAVLTILLEFLRRTAKEYDRYLVWKRTRNGRIFAATAKKGRGHKGTAATASTTPLNSGDLDVKPFRPTIWEQLLRALLHMLQFAVAYFIMLLAMYFNGYIIISIFLGSYLGAFLFQWEYMEGGRRATSASNEPTVCCA